MRRSPLAGRPSLRTSRSHPLVRELGDLARRNGIMGAVLITFTGAPDYRVGVNSCGEPNTFGKEMERLGDRILAAIDDGKFDPDPATPEPSHGR